LTGATPTIAWTAPATGTALFYRIDVWELNAAAGSRTFGTQVASVSTPETSFTFPPNILIATSAYTFVIAAFASTSAVPANVTALATAPFKSTIEVARATIGSGVFGAGYVITDARAIVPSGLAAPYGLARTASHLYWAEVGEPINYPPVSTQQGKIWEAD